MSVWNPPVFIIGQILNGVGLLIGLITLGRFLKRPRDQQNLHQQREFRWQGYEGYRRGDMGKNYARDYQDLRESKRRGIFRRKM